MGRLCNFWFFFFFLEKGHGCAFWEESQVHTQLSFDGLINLKDSYCGRVSDSGITAQTQYLIPKRACTLQILSHPLSRSFCSGHGKYRQTNSDLELQGKKVPIELQLKCQDWGEERVLIITQNLLWQCLQTFLFADLLPKNLNFLCFGDRGATLPRGLLCILCELAGLSHLFPNYRDTQGGWISLCCVLLCLQLCAALEEKTQTVLGGQC